MKAKHFLKCIENGEFPTEIPERLVSALRISIKLSSIRTTLYMDGVIDEKVITLMVTSHNKNGE